MTPDTLPLTDALVAFLSTQTGFPVGWGSAPLDADGVPYSPAQQPFVIVYPIPGGDTWGPFLCAPDAGAMIPYQVTSVGARGDQAALVADRVRQAMIGRGPGGQLADMAVPGMTVLDRQLTVYGGQDREGDVVSVPDSFLVHVTL